MPTISEQLTQLISDRDDLVDNLTTKGISGLTGDETFTELVPEVLNIPSGGGGIDWTAIGYDGEPQSIIDGYNYAVEIMQNWDSTRTNLSYRFVTDRKLIIMPLVDTSNCTNFSSMCNGCTALTTFPQINTLNGTNFSSMCNGCTALTTFPQINTLNGTNFNGMCNGCRALTTFPQINTLNGTNFSSMVFNCSALTIFPQINTSNGNIFSDMCNGCTALTTFPQINTSNGNNFRNMFTGCRALTTLGGFVNLGQAYLTTAPANNSSYTLNLSNSTLLTHDSLMNVINNLYDIATKGCNTQQLILGSTNLAKLSASEIQVATDKGWSLS